MADNEGIKIQPGDEADGQVGTPPDAGATETLSSVDKTKWAGMNDEQKLAYLDNASKFISSATQKSQEAAEVRRQYEQLKAERDYFKSEKEKGEELITKYSDYLTSQQQPAVPASSQPPKFDPYNPEKSWEELNRYHDERLNQANSKYDELRQDMESLKEETNVGLRTMKMEQYLEKARPALKCNDVSDEEVYIWHQQHPEVQVSLDSINQALRERQSVYNAKVEAKYAEYLKEKEQAALGAQEVPGSPLSGEMPDISKFVDMTPTERDEKVAEFFNRSVRKFQGGGG